MITASAAGFEDACYGLAREPQPVLAVVTGFLIPHARPPCAETDGPLGALFLARALVPLGTRVILAGEEFVLPALEAGLSACGLQRQVPLVRLPSSEDARLNGPEDYWHRFARTAGRFSHLLALERVGPSHTLASLRLQGAAGPMIDRFLQEGPPPEHWDRCHTMGGTDITEQTSPAHWLFEAIRQERLPVTTIGIGDGGNEIGMGSILWEVIRKNVPHGGLVACRVPVHHLIVCGVSNWGAYGLAAGVAHLRGECLPPALLDPSAEETLLRFMVERGPLVDGRTGRRSATVDGLSFERYAEPLRRIRSACAAQ